MSAPGGKRTLERHRWGCEGPPSTETDKGLRRYMVSALQRPRARSVVAMALLLGVICTVAVVWPLLSYQFEQWRNRRAYSRADDSLQWDLVRAYLRQELDRSPRERLYFDTKSAALCSLDQPEPCDRFESLSAEREGQLVDGTNRSIPLELQHVLDRLAMERTYNPAPRMDDVNLLPNAELGSFEAACEGAPPPNELRLIRMSRAAVHIPSGRAVAMVQRWSCADYDNSRFFVVDFVREGASWKVGEGDGNLR